MALFIGRNTLQEFIFTAIHLLWNEKINNSESEYYCKKLHVSFFHLSFYIEFLKKYLKNRYINKRFQSVRGLLFYIISNIEILLICKI